MVLAQEADEEGVLSLTVADILGVAVVLMMLHHDRGTRGDAEASLLSAEKEVLMLAQLKFVIPA
eukprot:CAMPEP_0177642920 /NCGR_PEP_ID=MMETSP0447-20121125/7875_1 /TAXON_ID=0 /ORGANISM="Stygamoeba regulata, Strain BSH-02190019" /LENGTH=63 /DNA_ID=CAMNT_0019145173 /DNA_START=207 /DNA_END=398 /DNA_ORIENTATION=+